MMLRVFLPAIERPDDATTFAWTLFDARHEVLREGETLPGEAPRARTVEAVLPAERVLFARLRLPRVNAATIRELLPFAVEDRLLADPSQVHAVAGRANARGETIVAVVDRGWLRAMVEALRGAGLAPSRAWCESELLAGEPGAWHVVWGAQRGLLVEQDGVSATFDRGEGIPLAVRIALDEAAMHGARPASIHVHPAGGATLPDLAQWSLEAGAPFVAGRRWEDVAKAQPSAGAIDVLRDDGSESLTWRALPRAALALGAAIVAVQLGFTAADAWRLSRERDALEARREAIFRAAFPEARVVVDPDLQMARNLAELQRERGIAAGDDFLAQMTRLARERSSPVESVEYANGRLVAR